MVKTKIIAIRHGETEWNIEARCQGHKDSPLTENGVKQAESVALRLTGYNLSTIYTSDLGRAVQTAEIISESSNLNIKPDLRLRERNMGVLQGLTDSEMVKSYPGVCSNLKKLDPDYIVPNGDSIRQSYNKNIECLNEIARSHPENSVLIVTHGGVLSGFFKYVVGLPLDSSRKFKVWSGSINTFSYDGEGWELLGWGDVSHLKGITILNE